MPHLAIRILEVVTASLALSGCGYYLLCLWSARQFLQSLPGNGSNFTPPISILKPLRSTDPEMYESFRSHCLQDYPEYEVIFGVSDAADPAVPLVERLQKEFPRQAIRLIVCDQALGANLKVSNLAQMLPRAQFPYLLVNDSDIRVGPGYLRRIIAPLADQQVGLVTCLYRGVAGPTLGSRLEQLGIATDFCAGVLAAHLVENGLHFGLGSTLVFRRNDLQTMGGFEALLDCLADDYELGRRLSAGGWEVQLSEVVVETFLPWYSPREFWQHQLRWARTIRASRRWGYLGLIFTFGLPWAFLALSVARGALWAWVLLSVSLALRVLMALQVGLRVVGDRQVLEWLWLLPLRDTLALLVWVGSYLGNTITWRGDVFRLKGRKLTRLDS